MDRHGSALVLAVILLFALPAQAAADEAAEPEPPPPPPPQRSFADRPVHVMATAGFGTLVGFGGLTVGYSLHDRVELGAGIGVNASGAMGGPYARVRPLVGMRRKSRWLHALAVDLGLSAGGYYQSAHRRGFFHVSDSLHDYESDLALFLQMELSWEMVTLNGFSLRLGGGGSALLNPGNVECLRPEPDAATEACEAPPSFFPVWLVQVGTTF